MTVAHPDGRFAVTEWAAPVRTRRHGRWENLNPALRRNTNGTLSPAVTASALALSGGGTGPLAVMTTDARTLSLSWPGGPLPVPTVSGATATYANVIPGVDLAVTASPQGGFSEVFIIKSAAAAASLALTSLQFTATAPGMTVTADGGGNLQVGPAGQTAPTFTAGTPLAWDSAPLPPGTPTTTTQDGELVEAQSGAPVSASAAAPGAGSHTATVPLSVSGNTITLSPPGSVLGSSSTVYPVYIDPTWWPAGSTASAWTQVDSGYATTSYWKESSDLQLGLCDFAGCNNVKVARSFLRMPIPSQITSKSVVNSAYLYTTEEWAPSCNTKSVRLYTTGSISSSTTWNNQPSWSSNYTYQDAAFGYDSSCPYYKDDVTWDVTSTIQGDAGNQSTQTWGIRAADETDDLAWKQFFSPAHSTDYPHMTVYYNDPPGHPGRTTSPGGTCQYSAGSAPTIGNDDVTFYADVSDDDGDNSLTTEFLILNSGGSTVYDSNGQTPPTSPTTGDNSTAQLTLTRPQMQKLGAGTYHWYALVTDNNNLTSTMPTDECYFIYNPNGPTAPDVGLPSPASGTLGQPITATFSTPGCGSGTDPCPVSYTYQIGASPPAQPVTAAANGGNTNVSIAIPRVGPIVLAVYGTASGGNVSPAATPMVTGTAPSSPYVDGDFNGDGKPDLLTLGANATYPGLWLSPTNGAGTLSPATDIGGAGTGINGGPGDWAHAAVVLHGDFTGHAVQDVMAYYPKGTDSSGDNPGTAVILAGAGDGSPLQPTSGSSWTLSQYSFLDPATSVPPFTMVAAGNASQASTGTADLIGIAGSVATSTQNNYTLDLFTDSPGGGPTGYGFSNYVLSAQSPDGATPSDWNNFQLATVQLPDTGHPTGDPANTALFALDTATGALYESTNPSAGTSCPNMSPPNVPASCTLIGTPQSTWTSITAPWGASAPTLLSGDDNSAGQAELWAQSGSTITAYTLSGKTLSAEHSGSLNQPLNDWPLGEGTGTTAADTIAGQNATMTTGATWVPNDPGLFTNHIHLDGSTGYLTPPASAIPSGTTPPKISVWFKTTTPGGVLISVQKSPLSSGPALPSQFDPVLYVGTDGKLYGEWWNGSVDPAVSASPVDDGIWHHAVLAATASSQTLTVDGGTPVTVSGATSFQFTPANITFGAGYIGGNWPTEPNYKQSGASDYRWYVNGEIADITYSYPGGP